MIEDTEQKLNRMKELLEAAKGNKSLEKHIKPHSPLGLKPQNNLRMS